MVSQTRGQSNRSSNKAEASTSQTISAGTPPNIVDPREPGPVTELGAADGNKATNPNKNHGSDVSNDSESRNSDTNVALDKQIAHATRTQDRLLKQCQLENINQEIKALEQENRPGSNVRLTPNPPIKIYSIGSKRP